MDRKIAEFRVEQRVRAKAGKLKGRRGTVKRSRISEDSGYVFYAIQLDITEGADQGPCSFIEGELETIDGEAVDDSCAID